MGRENYEMDYNNGRQQKDIVLSTNEFMFIQNKTNGQIKTHTGPSMVTISGQDSMIVFNPYTKKFEETMDRNAATQLFTSAPEGWYVVLKNPAEKDVHPEAGHPSTTPELHVGKKININGPCSFALFPGQMAKVIQGHRLRTNQYLIARVYDADAAKAASATMIDVDGEEVVKESDVKYFVGQQFIIKGTEVSFYVPPTGIEVVPTKKNEYVREAVTLENLEYVILKDENGEKVYQHGPAVVFPEPTQSFVETPKGGYIYRALELSPISGIYVKVIADYEENGVKHATGEELFITGNEQMIYYPRPEHALIQYDGKYMHHAIAIPEGEGRYILNRLTGEIKTVKGPDMYLPNPKTEVVVKRKLSPKECKMYYPGNKAVEAYNAGLNEKAVEKLAREGRTNVTADVLNMAYATNSEASLAIFEANANISRGVSYTKPRTITLDTKFDGVVSIDVWSGYAVSVIAKDGSKRVVCGPQTVLLDYDETLETVSTPDGETVFLKLKNNRISSTILAKSSESIDVRMSISYRVDFDETSEELFVTNDYYRLIGDTVRNAVKVGVEEYTVEDIYDNVTEIIRGIILEENDFTIHGASVVDVEVVDMSIDGTISSQIESHKRDMLNKTMELADAKAKEEIIKALAENEKLKARLNHENKEYIETLNHQLEEERLENKETIKEIERQYKAAQLESERAMQECLDEIHKADLAREEETMRLEIKREEELARIEKEKNDAQAEMIAKVMGSITPGLVEALSAKSNADILTEGMRSIAPYSLAGHEDVSETINRIVRGTTLEEVVKNFPIKSE